MPPGSNSNADPPEAPFRRADRSALLRNEFVLAQRHEAGLRRALTSDPTPQARLQWDDALMVLSAAAHEFFNHMRMNGDW